MTVSFDIGVLRAAALLVPLLLAVALLVAAPRSRRLRGAALLATLWNFFGLLAVNAGAVAAGWWTFGTEGTSWAGVPVDVIIGWALLWGAVPILMGTWVNPVLIGVILVAADLLAMGRLQPLVTLHGSWLWGEAAAVGGALIPGLVLGVATHRQWWLRVRVGLQTMLFTALLLFAIPTATFESTGSGWTQRLEQLGGPADLILLQLAFLVGIVALRAVTEFARHGGTPFPWDPPTALVITGPYAYVANPMQLSAALLLVIGAAAVSDPWLLLVAISAIAFSAGIAAWSERGDLRLRFGDSWIAYRHDVHDWWPRWRPTELRPVAVLYPARTCEPCSQVGSWFRGRGGVRLSVVVAEDHEEPLQRLRYQSADWQSADFRADGMRAVGCGLEHLHLGWALAGWVVRAPGIASFAQMLADAVGAGPRTPVRTE